MASTTSNPSSSVARRRLETIARNLAVNPPVTQSSEHPATILSDTIDSSTEPPPGFIQVTNTGILDEPCNFDPEIMNSYLFPDHRDLRKRIRDFFKSEYFFHPSDLTLTPCNS
jgi:hypothetical protein